MTYLDGVHGLIIGGMNLSIEIECGYENGKLETYNILEQDRERKVSLRRAAGAHKIASYLREQGADVEVIDYAFIWTFEELKDLWKSRYYSKTLFLGISTTFHQASAHLWQFVEWVRENYPHIAIIGGTQSIDKLLGFHCDYYIYGYGEIAAFELIKNIKDGTTSKIKYNEINGKKVINAQINYKAFPKKELSVSYEDRDFIKPHEVLDIEFARGCIFQCAFCTYPILGVRDDHSRCEHNLHKELLENYERWGTTRYNISDETANDYHKKLERYASVVRKLPFKPDMQGYARADILVGTEKHWQTYVDLGFMSHFYGVESLTHAAAKSIGKGMDSERLKDGLLKFKEWAYKNNDGFYVAFMSLIAGLPNETYETLTEQVEWLRKNWYDQFSVMGVLQIHMPNATSQYKEFAKDLGNVSLIERDPAGYGYEITGPSKFEKLHSKVKRESYNGQTIWNRFSKEKGGHWLNYRDNNDKKLDKIKGGGVQWTHGQEWGLLQQIDKNSGDDKSTGKYIPDLEKEIEPISLTVEGATDVGETKEYEMHWPLIDDAAKKGSLLKDDDGEYKSYRMAGQTTTRDSIPPPVHDSDLKVDPHFKTHNEWVSNTGLTVRGINKWMKETAIKYALHDMPTITQGSIASWNQLEFYVDPSVERADMMKKGKNTYKVNADVLTRTIQGTTGVSEGGVQFGSAGDKGANELYYHKKKFLMAYKRNKLNA